MLKATYKDNTYTFYVTLKDAEQYKASLIPTTFWQSEYLIKFTNDMSGTVKFAYAQNVTINDRYAKFEIFNSGITSNSVFDGIVNFDETGYWKYEIFWIWEGESTSNCKLFDTLNKGFWVCYDSSNTVKEADVLDVDNYTIANLTASSYTILELSSCNPPQNPFVPAFANALTSITALITDFACKGVRNIIFTKVERNIDTATFTMQSFLDVGQEIRFISQKRNYSYIIKTKPETVVMTVETGTGIADSQKYNVQVFTGGTFNEQYNDVIAVRKPQQFRGGYIMASNNEYDATCGNGLDDGNIIFTWNGTGNSPTSGYVTPFEAPIEIGKLLIEEPIGDEQVRYTQHESPKDTNYIYND